MGFINEMITPAFFAILITFFMKSILQEFGKTIIRKLFNTIGASILLVITSLIVMVISVYTLHTYVIDNPVEYTNSDVKFSITNKKTDLINNLCPTEEEVFANISNNKFKEPFYSEANDIAKKLKGINIISLRLFKDFSNYSSLCHQFYNNGVLLNPVELNSIIEFRLLEYNNIDSKLLQLIKNNGIAPSGLSEIVYDGSDFELIGKLVVTESYIIQKGAIYIPIKDDVNQNTLYGYVKIQSLNEITDNRLQSVKSNVDKIKLVLKDYIRENKINQIREVLNETVNKRRS